MMTQVNLYIETNLLPATLVSHNTRLRPALNYSRVYIHVAAFHLNIDYRYIKYPIKYNTNQRYIYNPIMMIYQKSIFSPLHHVHHLQYKISIPATMNNDSQ